MKKNTKIILAVLGFILLLLVVFINIYSAKKVQNAQHTKPTPTLGIYPTLSVKDQIRTQQQSDIYTGQLKAESEKLYPWQDKLPIQTTEYFVYFDEDKKKFIAKVYLKNRAVEIVKNEIVAELQQQGFPLNTYPIEWMIK